MPARGTKRRFLGLLANRASDPGSAYIVAGMMGPQGTTKSLSVISSSREQRHSPRNLPTDKHAGQSEIRTAPGGGANPGFGCCHHVRPRW